jgi:phosphoketolase
MIYVLLCGHGGPAVVGNSYHKGRFTEVYREISRDETALKKLFRQLSFPGGTPSRASLECPGPGHEGSELGYSLSQGFGTCLGNPALIVACIVGDGEAETGPLPAGGGHHRSPAASRRRLKEQLAAKLDEHARSIRAHGRDMRANPNWRRSATT